MGTVTPEAVASTAACLGSTVALTKALAVIADKCMLSEEPLLSGAAWGIASLAEQADTSNPDAAEPRHLGRPTHDEERKKAQRREHGAHQHK